MLIPSSGLNFPHIFLVFLIGIVGSIFWIWMLIDCITKETDQNNQRLIWILLIVFLGIIGALLYLIIRRQQRMIELGK